MAAASVQVLRSATLMGPDELGTALKGAEELGTAPSRRSLSRAGSRGFPSTRGLGSPAGSSTRGLGSPAGAQGKRAGERRDDSPLASSQGHVSEGHVSEVHPSPSRHPSPDGVPASGRPGMHASSADARPPLDSSASSGSSAYFGGVARRMQSPPSTPPASTYASLGGGAVGASSPRDGASSQRDGGVEGGRRGRPTGTCRMTPTDLRRSASESKLGNSSASESGQRPPNGFPHAPSQPRGGSRTGSRESHVARDAMAEHYAYTFGALSTLVGPDPRPCLACKCSPRRPCPLPHRWAPMRRRFGS